jgi:putative addiction module component (TIGR02574 family)
MPACCLPGQFRVWRSSLRAGPFLGPATEGVIVQNMNTHVGHVIDEALALAPDERSAVVVALLDSLDGDDASTVTKAWAVEIQQRRNDLRSGATKAMPGNEARSRLAGL